MNLRKKPKSPIVYGVMVLFAGFLLSVGILPALSQANNTTVVSIYDQGKKKVVSTTATTVDEVLRRADITVTDRDLVEPGLYEPIDSEVFHVNIYRAQPILIIDGTHEIRTTSAYQNPSLIAERSAGLAIYPEDDLKVETISNFIVDGTIGKKVTITRAMPITLNMDGRSLLVRTHGKTVEEMLKTKGVVLTGEDFVIPSKDTVVKSDMAVTVTRVGHEVVAQEEIILAETEIVYDVNRPVGYEQIRETGKEGRRLVTYEIKYHNGQEVFRSVLQTVEVEPASKKVIIRGSGGSANAVLARLRQCESGDNYANKNNSVYRGAYQFDQSTWDSNAPAEYIGMDPADAPPAVQDRAVIALYNRRGWAPWPVCGSGLPPL